MDRIANLEIVKQVIENETAYSVGKNCGLSHQSVDKFKKGTADILNMKLKNAIEITEYGKKLRNRDEYVYEGEFKAVEVHTCDNTLGATDLEHLEMMLRMQSFKNLTIVEAGNNFRFNYLQCDEVNWDNMTFVTRELPLNTLIKQDVDLDMVKFALEKGDVKKIKEYLLSIEPTEIELFKNGEKNLDKMTLENARILTTLARAWGYRSKKIIGKLNV